MIYGVARKRRAFSRLLSRRLTERRMRKTDEELKKLALVRMRRWS